MSLQDAACFLQVGMSAELTEEVDESNIASRAGSGSLPVYGTPYMVAALERAAVGAVDASLPDGWITVGISVQVRHPAPTPVGGEVRARAELVEIDGRRLIFRVSAHDGRDTIGEGVHERFCVHRDGFLRKAAEK